MTDDLKNWRSVNQAARALKMTTEGVRKAIKGNRIKADKIGNQFFIHKDELKKVLYKQKQRA